VERLLGHGAASATPDRFIAAIGSHDEDTVCRPCIQNTGNRLRWNMEMFIAPQGLKADALVGMPAASTEESS